MPTYTKLILSGSVDGTGIRVTATATPGTLIHTATSGAGQDTFDELWVYAGCTQPTPVNTTIQLGTETDDKINVHSVVPGAYGGLICLIPGFPIRNGLVVSATAATAQHVNIFGFVNRIVGQ